LTAKRLVDTLRVVGQWTRDLEEPVVVRFADLRATWRTPRATEAGYLRWLVSYVGGPEGHINPSPETGLLSDRYVIGLMGLPAGNRQAGLHIHTITEIYVLLRGRVESLEGDGRTLQAGPGDCLCMPRGAPHGVRAIGDEDVLLVWVHDGNERRGAARYLEPGEEPPGAPAVTLIRGADLSPRQPEAVGGRLRTEATWLRGRVILEELTIPAGNAEPARDGDAVYLVTHGRGRLTAHAGVSTLEPLDAVVRPGGIRNAGLEPLRVIRLEPA
jgi:quercetin dioxygenase-like cupin family protein